MCEKNARLDVLIFCRRCPQPPNVQCCCELGGGSGGCEINARFCKAHALKLTATLNIGGRGGSARKRQERPSGRFFSHIPESKFCMVIARKNVKTTDSNCESECVNDGCPSVRPSVIPCCECVNDGCPSVRPSVTPCCRHVLSRLVLLRHVQAFWLAHVNACGPMVLQVNVHTIKDM